ncbi:GGDEF domain-containing phosphodiesterase [Acinetobacter apis]|uniref:Diguanylate cyclase/phosphodiesterase with PAS/PAC sensor(S) n=1 Tax=Acinetobacter apis TaxID=1229165 RepID=A0A217ECR2_9GAMM|nr:EAL domain-containing protein [Acinetobacter apis]SNQ28309.1 diguanylate cyclase/phosphodiesterase with PAS/PAC sensor(s) [Acinetobacter apis]
MPFTQNDLLNEKIKQHKIKHSAQTIPYFLATTFLTYFFIFINYRFNSSNHEFIFNTYFIVSSILSISAFIYTQWFAKNIQNIQIKHHFHEVITLITGLNIGFFVYLVHIYLPSNYHHLLFSDTFYLALVLVISSLFFALVYLSYRLIYFFLVALPVCFPILLLQPLPNDTTNPFIPLSFNFIFIAVCLCAISLNRLYTKHVKQLIKSESYIEKHQDQLKVQQHQQQNLNTKLEKMLQTQHDLEGKNEHTQQQLDQYQHQLSDQISLIYKQQHIIELAKKTTYNHTWEWDITAGIFKENDQFFATLKNDAIIEKYLEGIIHPDDIAIFLKQLKHHFIHQDEIFQCECRIFHGNTWVWFAAIGQIIQNKPGTVEPTFMIGLFKNIEQQKQDRDRIEQSSNIIKYVDLGIVILDAKLNYVSANPFFYKMTGLSERHVLEKNIFEITDSYDTSKRSLHYSITDQVLKKGQFKGEFEERFISGKELNMRCHIQVVKDEYLNTVQYVGIISDLTDYKQQEKRLSYLENYDTVTRLPNRFYYNYKVYEYLITERQNISQLAIIHLSIDRFTALNEFLGNQTTTLLLQQVAEHLRITNPNAFMIAYLNREEFVLVYEIDHTCPSIQETCGQIVSSFSEPLNVANQELILTVSLGAAIFPEHALDFDQLNNHAHQALLQAQRVGGNTVQYYSKDQNNAYIQDVDLENKLRQAIKNNELEVYYQPKIQLSNHQIVSFEALIRWKHPEKGLMSPAYFLSFARQTSLISDIGEYVLEASVHQLKIWQDLNLPKVRISINVDPQQLYRGKLLKSLDEILATYQMDGDCLEFEITESSLVEKTDYIRDLLNEFKARNIKLSLDDFGTGYSSLAYLTEFPFDIIKIDRYFVKNMHNKTQKAVLNAIIAMGKAMSLVIVVEGVETQEELDFFHQKECDIVQGYFFSKPLNATDASLYLQQIFR